jgi:hypothetical protein
MPLRTTVCRIGTWSVSMFDLAMIAIGAGILLLFLGYAVLCDKM